MPFIKELSSRHMDILRGRLDLRFREYDMYLEDFVTCGTMITIKCHSEYQDGPTKFMFDIKSAGEVTIFVDGSFAIRGSVTLKASQWVNFKTDGFMPTHATLIKELPNFLAEIAASNMAGEKLVNALRDLNVPKGYEIYSFSQNQAF